MFFGNGENGAKIGNSIFFSDGQVQNRIGNARFEGGNCSAHIGNTDINTKGTVSQIGNSFFTSEGSYSMIGNTLFGPNGSSWCGVESADDARAIIFHEQNKGSEF